MTDRLILGPVAFENADYSPPTRMPFGGAQAMIVHKLPGGSRVIDTLGPDEDDISWSGFFFADNALSICQQLDAMRASGQVFGLTYGGMFRSVIIKRFKPHIRRFPHWVEYEISCTVTANPAFGALFGATVGPPGPVSFDTLVQNDLQSGLNALSQ